MKKQIQVEQIRVYNELSRSKPGTPEYDHLLGTLDKLNSLLRAERLISPEVIFAGAINLVNLVSILRFEETGSITSKTFNTFFKKL